MSEPKRVAIYTSSFPPRTGGIASAHFNLFQSLSRRHDVKVFVFHPSSDPSTDGVFRGDPLPGVTRTLRFVFRRLLRQPMGKTLPRCDAIAETGASVLRLNAQLRRFSPHLILCPDHFLPALMLKKPVGTKLAWMARHNYLRFAHQPLCPPNDFIDLHLAHRLERRAVRKADILISPSIYMRDLFQGMFGSELPAYIAPNFMDRQRLEVVHVSDLRQRLGVGERVPIIYIPSGGSKIKGARYTFEIVRRLGAAHQIAAYVPGPMDSVLQYELEHLVPHIAIHAPGHVPYDENLANVASCDLTVSPTLIENLSNALVESIMMGVPVVTFDTGGNREVVQCGRTGHVVPYGDVEALIAATSTLLSDPSELSALKSACKQEASQIIDHDGIDAVYDEVLAGL